MGTYTNNYQLYMPTVGETGWGTLINGNYQTIDTTMKGLSDRTTVLENTDVTFNTRVTAIEDVVSNGDVNSSAINNSGIITSTGGFKGWQLLKPVLEAPFSYCPAIEGVTVSAGGHGNNGTYYSKSYTASVTVPYGVKLQENLIVSTTFSAYLETVSYGTATANYTVTDLLTGIQTSGSLSINRGDNASVSKTIEIPVYCLVTISISARSLNSNQGVGNFSCSLTLPKYYLAP